MAFYAEFVGYRYSDQGKFMEGLARTGKQAVEDYERTIQKRKQKGNSPGRMELD